MDRSRDGFVQEAPVRTCAHRVEEVIVDDIERIGGRTLRQRWWGHAFIMRRRAARAVIGP
jgi:hypothetical protein